MRIVSVESTDLFTGTAQRPLQLIRVTLVNEGPGMLATPAMSAAISVQGPGVRDPGPFGISDLNPGEQKAFEVPVEIAAPYQPGSTRHVTVTVTSDAGLTQVEAGLTVAEPGDAERRGGRGCIVPPRVLGHASRIPPCACHQTSVRVDGAERVPLLGTRADAWLEGVRHALHDLVLVQARKGNRRVDSGDIRRLAVPSPPAFRRQQMCPGLHGQASRHGAEDHRPTAEIDHRLRAGTRDVA